MAISNFSYLFAWLKANHDSLVSTEVTTRTLIDVHASNNVEATLSNAISRTILSTKSNVASTLLPFLATMLPVLATMSNEISSFGKVETN